MRFDYIELKMCTDKTLSNFMMNDFIYKTKIKVKNAKWYNATCYIEIIKCENNKEYLKVYVHTGIPVKPRSYICKIRKIDFIESNIDELKETLVDKMSSIFKERNELDEERIEENMKCIMNGDEKQKRKAISNYYKEKRNNLQTHKKEKYSPLLRQNIYNAMDEIDYLIYIAKTGQRLLNDMDNAAANYDGTDKTYEEEILFDSAYNFLTTDFSRILSCLYHKINTRILDGICTEYDKRKHKYNFYKKADA